MKTTLKRNNKHFSHLYITSPSSIVSLLHPLRHSNTKSAFLPLFSSFPFPLSLPSVSFPICSFFFLSFFSLPPLPCFEPSPADRSLAPPLPSPHPKAFHLTAPTRKIYIRAGWDHIPASPPPSSSTLAPTSAPVSFLLSGKTRGKC